MPSGWKPDIVALTELPAARAGKIDASFFPPVAEECIAAWERENGGAIPTELRSYLLASDGLEAARGELWPVLPFRQWEWIDLPCASAHPWIRFGEGRDHLYLISLGHSPSIYRHERFGDDLEFFAKSFRAYLEKVFAGES